MNCPLCGDEPLPSIDICPTCMNGSYGDEGLAAVVNNQAGYVALDRDDVTLIRSAGDLIRGKDVVVTEHAKMRWEQRIPESDDPALCCASAWAAGKEIDDYSYEADGVRRDVYTGADLLQRSGYIVTVVANKQSHNGCIDTEAQM